MGTGQSLRELLKQFTSLSGLSSRDVAVLIRAAIRAKNFSADFDIGGARFSFKKYYGGPLEFVVEWREGNVTRTLSFELTVLEVTRIVEELAGGEGESH